MRIASVVLLAVLGPFSLHSQQAAVLLMAQQLSPAPIREPLVLDRVAGRVLRSTDKHPIARATVTLGAEQGRRTVLSTHTDAEGRYSFDPQPAGRYVLHASATAYLGSSYLEHEGFFSAVILGAGLKTSDLIVELTPNASITGHVLDPSGDPVQHASLTLFREDPSAVAQDASATTEHVVLYRNAQTDDDGSFEFPDLGPGQFYLSVTATPWYAVHPRADASGSYIPYRMAVDPALDVAYPVLFYPGAQSSEEAAPFVVKAGEHITADMVLRAERALTLSFHLPPLQPGETPRYRLPQLTRTVFGVEQPVFAQNSNSDAQTLTLTGLTPGRYTLRQFSPNGGIPVNAGSVNIGSESVSMDLPPDAATAGAPVTVKLHGAGGAALPSGLNLLLRSAERGPYSTESQPAKQGAVEFAAVSAGDYRFFAFHEGRNFPVLALALNGKPVSGNRLHVSGSDLIKVDLTLSSYAPRVEGVAQKGGRGVPGCMVVLVPAGADTSEDLFRRDQSDLDGSFALQNVVPGNYLLVAIEDGWPLRWNDPKALLPYLLHALPLTVPSSGAPTIHTAESALVQPR